MRHVCETLGCNRLRAILEDKTEGRFCHRHQAPHNVRAAQAALYEVRATLLEELMVWSRSEPMDHTALLEVVKKFEAAREVLAKSVAMQREFDSLKSVTP